ncbi:hypothetical protein NC651_010837 [Populus alba x Populus x berolinensis]|nr:hypothetical protein NC651_010837 [Populus alba x Populus x berolinensis]
MHGPLKENFQLNIKVLQEKSMPEPYSFKALVEISRDAFPGNKMWCILPVKWTFLLLMCSSLIGYLGNSLFL